MERQKRCRLTSWPIGIRVSRCPFPPLGVAEKLPLWPNMLPRRPPSWHRRHPSWCTSRLRRRRLPVPIRTPRRIIPRRPTLRTRRRITIPISTMLIIIIIIIRATIPLGSYGEACRLLVPSSTMGVLIQVVVNKIVMGVLVITLVGFRNIRRSVPGTRVVPKRNDPRSKFN